MNVGRTFPNQTNPRIALLEKMPKSAVCAEIGVWKGEFSEWILQITSPSCFHLVDPWEYQCEFPERMYGGSVAKNQVDMDQIYQSVKNKFSPFSNVIFNKGKSQIVLNEFDDDYFDWVYIDGNHYYDYVLHDLEICYLKVKSHGMITGDDYTWGAKDGFPVMQAVQDFVNKKKLPHKLEIIESQYIIRLGA